MRPRHERLALNYALERKHFSAKQERVAGRQRLQKIFFDLAQNAPAARQWSGIGGAGGIRKFGGVIERTCCGAGISGRRSVGASAYKPHFQHVGFNDRADVHAPALRDFAVGDAPQAVLVAFDFCKAFVSAQSISAIGHEFDCA